MKGAGGIIWNGNGGTAGGSSGICNSRRTGIRCIVPFSLLKLADEFVEAADFGSLLGDAVKEFGDKVGGNTEVREPVVHLNRFGWSGCRLFISEHLSPTRH